jgi:hypothetical protein
MKLVKSIGFIFITISLVLLAVQFNCPDVSVVERKGIINANDSMVHHQISTLKQWENWSPWRNNDPNMELVYNEKPSGAGASYTWKSEKRNVGAGKVTILADADSVIKMEMDFNNNGKALVYFKLKPVFETTELTWRMESETTNPITKLFGLMMDNMVGKDYEKGIQNLDSLCVKLRNS